MTAPRLIERALLGSRWLLLPMFLALLLGLLAIVAKAAQHVVHMAETLFTAGESEVVLSVLGLVDLTLAANLVLIVMISGYENFVTAIEADGAAPWPAWLATIDFAGMTLKVLASAVTISAIELLGDAMSLAERTDREMAWSAGALICFVVAGLLLALTDRVAGHAGDPIEK